jgi:hypothetical protein
MIADCRLQIELIGLQICNLQSAICKNRFAAPLLSSSNYGHSFPCPGGKVGTAGADELGIPLGTGVCGANVPVVPVAELDQELEPKLLFVDVVVVGVATAGVVFQDENVGVVDAAGYAVVGLADELLDQSGAGKLLVEVELAAGVTVR